MFFKIKNHILKNLSILLSSITLLHTFPPTALAANHKSLSTNQKLRRNIPRSLNISLEQQLSRRKFWRTNIYQMSEESVKEQLYYEFVRYINRAPDVFKIDEELIRKSNPRALLINLSTLNYLFDKYNPLTEKLIKIKRHSTNRTFKLMLKKKSESKTLQSSTIDLGGIFLNNTRNSYEEEFGKISRLTNGYLSKINKDQAYESAIIHEFGHLMTFLYTIDKYHLNMSGIRTTHDQKLTDSISQLLSKFVKQNYTKVAFRGEFEHYCRELDSMGLNNAEERQYVLEILPHLKPNKQREFLEIVRVLYCNNLSQKELYLSKKIDSESKIIKKAITQGINTEDKNECPMGTYGNTDSSEFVAEAFAHLECSNPKDVSKLGKETERFIIEKMKFLPNEKATFP